MDTTTIKEIRGQKENLDLIQTAMEHGLPTLLVGHQGSGKTKIIHAVANHLGKPVTRINLTGQTGEDELAGKMGLLNGATHFTDGPLTIAVREGHVLVLDELNAANAEVLFLLNPLLDDGKFIRLMGKDGEIVKAHPDFRMFATINPPDYVGTKELNPALLSRFNLILNIEYAKPKEEAKILIQYTPNLSETMAITMVEFAQIMREAFYGGETSNIVSTRDLLSWASLSVRLDSLKRAFEPAMLNRAIQSKSDRERMKKEFLKVTKDTEAIGAITEPLSLITEALAVQQAQSLKLQEIADASKALDVKEKKLAKYAVEEIDKLVNKASQSKGHRLDYPEEILEHLKAQGVTVEVNGFTEEEVDQVFPPTNGHIDTTKSAGGLIPMDRASIKAREAAIKTMLDEGKTIGEIKDELGLSYKTVYGISKRINVAYGKSVGLVAGDSVIQGGEEFAIEDSPVTEETFG